MKTEALNDLIIAPYKYLNNLNHLLFINFNFIILLLLLHVCYVEQFLQSLMLRTLFLESHFVWKIRIFLILHINYVLRYCNCLIRIISFAP